MSTGKSKGILIDVREGAEIVLVRSGPGGVDTEEITLTLYRKDGKKARLGIDAPDHVRIVRPPKSLAVQS